ncbi:MAG: hypothetical protein LBR77_09710 [Lachnospiraceae bacterium]|jgi:hypothetical protein|nr:hypothetical protein [Lachnospiraceae bacterium]
MDIVLEKSDKIRAEALGYLGYGKKAAQVADSAVLALLDECLDELLGVVAPKEVHRSFLLKHVGGDSLAVVLDGETAADVATDAVLSEELCRKDVPTGMGNSRNVVAVHSGGGGTADGRWHITSPKLAAHLAGCHSVVLFAVTLGLGVDHLIRRYSKVQMSKAAVMQAASAALVEEVCDQVNALVADEEAAKGNVTVSRYSPGYGDFTLENQVRLTAILDTGRRIGVKLNESLLMSPSKSVTAVIGVRKAANRGMCKGL